MMSVAEAERDREREREKRSEDLLPVLYAFGSGLDL
jgi:hypothetical protein